LVPKSVTLNDLEGRNGRYFCVISPKAVAFAVNYVTLTEPRHIMFVTKKN